MHQADLLYLPHDIYQNTYKYALNVIDVASQYKVSRHLKTKKASVAEMFKGICEKGPRYPQQLHEFKSDVLRLMTEKDVTKKYHHNFSAFVERFNKTLAERRLFKRQDAQELQNPTEDSKTWVKYLQKTVQKFNSEKTRMLGMKPVKAVKLDNVNELKIKPYPKEEITPKDKISINQVNWK